MLVNTSSERLSIPSLPSKWQGRSAPVFQFAHALQHLHLPVKLVHLIFFCYRYIDVIGREYLRLRQAMVVRGFRARTSLHTYTSYAYLVGMLLVRSYERSQRVYQAMLCRGFNGTFHSLHDFSRSRLDYIGSAMMIVIILGLETIEWITTA